MMNRAKSKRSEGRTLADVARLMRVHPSTVSRAMSGGPVRERTRQRILETATRLGYMPNVAAAILRGRHPKLVGVSTYLPPWENMFGQAVLEGSANELRRSDFGVILIPFGTPRESWLLSTIEQGLLGGLISITHGTLAQEDYRLAIERGVPVVTVEYKWPGAPSVEIDQEAGGRIAAEHLCTRARNIVAFAPRPSTEEKGAMERRMDGFRNRLAEVGAGARYTEVPSNGPEFGEGLKAGRALCRHAARPLGVFCATGDRFALGVWQSMYEQGWRLKKDLFLVGYDNIPLAAYVTPGLTTVGQRLEEMGAIAAKLVMAGYRGERVPPDRHILPPVLIERGTT